MGDEKERKHCERQLAKFLAYSCDLFGERGKKVNLPEERATQ